MSLFRKITESVSKGVSTATEKAQQTVEITRLHTQISGKRREIDKLYADIGETVYADYRAKALSQTEPKVVPVCEQIEALEVEIEALESRILQLRGEKECDCGRKVSADTRFCPACGHAFPEPEVSSDPLIPQSSVSVDPAAVPEPETVEAPDAAPAENPATPAEQPGCDNCGAQLTADARFCPSCGKSFA